MYIAFSCLDMFALYTKSKAHRSIWEDCHAISFYTADTWNLSLDAEILFCHISRRQEDISFGNSVLYVDKWSTEGTREFWKIERCDSVISCQHLIVFVQNTEHHFVFFFSYDDIILVRHLYRHFREIDGTQYDSIRCNICSVDTE